MAGIHHENMGGLFHCHVRTAVAHGTPPSSDVHGGICLMYTPPISSHTQISVYISIYHIISYISYISHYIPLYPTVSPISCGWVFTPSWLLKNLPKRGVPNGQPGD